MATITKSLRLHFPIYDLHRSSEQIPPSDATSLVSLQIQPQRCLCSHVIYCSPLPAFDGVDLRRDILPKLQGLPVRVIAEAMGASISHGSKVRGGLLVPHKRHWNKLLNFSRFSA
jgi:hypothetical protein